MVCWANVALFETQFLASSEVPSCSYSACLIFSRIPSVEQSEGTSQCTLDLMPHVLRLDWEMELGKGTCFEDNKNIFAWSLTRNQSEKILRPIFLVLWSQQIIQIPLGHTWHPICPLMNNLGLWRIWSPSRST